MKKRVCYFVLFILLSTASSALYQISPSCTDNCISGQPVEYDILFSQNVNTVYYKILLTDNTTGKILADSGPIELIVENEASALLEGIIPEPGSYKIVPCFTFSLIDEQKAPTTTQLTSCGLDSHIMTTKTLEQAECQQDIDCSTTQLCVEFDCIDIECDPCEYVEDRKCLKYQCCDSDSCNRDQECIEHQCTKLSCSDRETISNHECVQLQCLEDEHIVNRKCVKLLCNDDEVAELHQCSKLKCSLFSKPESHECKFNSRLLWRILGSLLIILIIGAIFYYYYYYTKQEE